jgi:hypothetical protein
LCRTSIPGVVSRVAAGRPTQTVMLLLTPASVAMTVLLLAGNGGWLHVAGLG